MVPFSAVPMIDLVSAGESFEDLIFAGIPRLPRPGEEVRTSRFARTIGGGAVITAVAAARLGLRCAVISGLSTAAVRTLRSERIRAINVRRSREPHAVSAALSTATERSFVTYEGMNPKLEGRLAVPLTRLRSRHVHFAFTPARCRRWISALTRLRRAGATTSWDFGWHERLLDDDDFLRLAGAVDYLLLNEQEARLYSRARTHRAALAFWRDHSNVTIVKMGARGSSWISRGDTIAQPPVHAAPVDTTGAGDAFNGGFLASRLSGAGPREALAAGNRIGALSTRALGGITALPRGPQRP